MRSEQVSAAPAGAQRIEVPRIDQALDFYLSLGFEVHSVADGWALLRAGTNEVVLVEGTPSPQDPGRGQLTS